MRDSLDRDHILAEVHAYHFFSAILTVPERSIMTCSIVRWDNQCITAAICIYLDCLIIFTFSHDLTDMNEVTSELSFHETTATMDLLLQRG